MNCVVLLIVFVACMAAYSDATICEPLSKFRMDCNTCFCSADGTRYACTRKSCRGEPQLPDDYDYYNFQQKEQDQKDNVLPYIDDEIPSSREQWEQQQQSHRGGDIDIDEYVLPGNADDPRFEHRFQDIDLGDQEAEDIGGLDDNYRFKRNIFI